MTKQNKDACLRIPLEILDAATKKWERDHGRSTSNTNRRIVSTILQTYASGDVKVQKTKEQKTLEALERKILEGKAENIALKNDILTKTRDNKLRDENLKLRNDIIKIEKKHTDENRRLKNEALALEQSLKESNLVPLANAERMLDYQVDHISKAFAKNRGLQRERCEQEFSAKDAMQAQAILDDLLTKVEIDIKNYDEDELKAIAMA